MHIAYGVAAIFACTHGVAADYLMGSYPAPIDLSSPESLVSAAWQNLSSIFDDYLLHQNGSLALTGVENITFSTGMFSVHDPEAIGLQYHFTASEVANAPNGTRKVDSETIYRVASVSKLITAMTGMLVLTEEDWHRPLSEIDTVFTAHGMDPILSQAISRPQWDKITPWSLATQLSGLPKTGIPIGDAYMYALIDPTLFQTSGAPPVDLNTLGPCAQEVQGFCNANESIDFIGRIPPNFLPWSTPTYSNLNFMVLGMVMSNITGKPIKQLYREALFDPLGMQSTNDTVSLDDASIARTAIPDWASFNIPGSGFTIPSGGISSTISDLQRLGIGILNSTLLNPDITRRWMKPATLTGSYSYAIGAGWEIHRFVHPTTGRLTDLYTKLGDSGYYGGLLCVIPQYDAGFAFLATSTDSLRGQLDNVIIDHIVSAVVPALEAQAAAEAALNFAGHYESPDPNTNASVTIIFNSTNIPYISHSGLQVSEWSYNGTDVINGDFLNGHQPRLQPSIAKQTPDGVPGQVAFHASSLLSLPNALSYTDAVQIPELATIGPFTGFYNSFGDFAMVDNMRWAGVQTGLMVFDVDAQGKATALIPAVQRIKLQRVKSA